MMHRALAILAMLITLLLFFSCQPVEEADEGETLQTVEQVDAFLKQGLRYRGATSRSWESPWNRLRLVCDPPVPYKPPG
jgi:hypothetical protein